MKPLTLQQIAEACDGRLDPPACQVTVAGVSTDTRTIRPGDLFVALCGELHDGHEYLPDAFANGAVAAVISKPSDVPNPTVTVQDTLIAYGRIGALVRQQSDATFIAVTGSAGKTTTKDMLGAITAIEGPSLVTPRTENNEVGVPQLLLQLTPEIQFCVIELAMRGRGEIEYLANICRPHIGLITNIGEAHIGRLGSREAIAQVKAELLVALPADGHAVLNADDFFFGLHKEMSPCPVASFGLGAAPTEVEFHVGAEDTKARGVDPARFVLRIGRDAESIRLKVPGLHNVTNALAAAATAHAAGIGLEAIRIGLESYEGSRMRSEVIHAPGGYTIINDAYNASPTSTPEAMKVLGQCSGRRIMVFGDMLELGADSERAHRAIGLLCAETGVDWLLTIGDHAAYAAEEAEAAGLQVNVLSTTDEAVALLRDVLEPGDTLLVKASRGMALERVVEGVLSDA